MGQDESEKKFNHEFNICLYEIKNFALEFIGNSMLAHGITYSVFWTNNLKL